MKSHTSHPVNIASEYKVAAVINIRYQVTLAKLIIGLVGTEHIVFIQAIKQRLWIWHIIMHIQIMIMFTLAKKLFIVIIMDEGY